MRHVRQIWVVVHRVIGLSIAAFLVMAGLTGAIISWDQELDEWLNPQFYKSPGQGELLDPYEMAGAVEAAHPHVAVYRIPLQLEVGRSALFLVSPRIDPETKRPFEVGYNEVYVDPVTGEVRGRRDAGKLEFNREHLLTFLYKFHYTLHLPDLWGYEKLGEWVMGTIALIWLFDCFVGFYLTLPRRQAAVTGRWWSGWSKSWAVRWGHGGYRRIFDIHRAVSLWVWIVLATLALSAASLNLFSEIFRPVLLTFSKYSPSPSEMYKRVPANQRVIPGISFRDIVPLAEAEAKRLGWEQPINRIFYEERSGYYTASFFRRTDYLAVNGMPHRRIYLDGSTGKMVALRDSWKGSGADIFRQAQFPLHSGRIFGLPGRILISVMGVVVAVLAITGVVIWYRKWVARGRHRAGLRAAARGEVLSAR